MSYTSKYGGLEFPVFHIPSVGGRWLWAYEVSEYCTNHAL